MDTDDTGPKQLRITSNGKIKSFVSFALEFFQKYDSRPLVLHTLPRDPPGQTKGDLNNVTLVIPRLISVVEIIKREYIKILVDTHSPRLVGLHQYNQLGTLEDLGYGETVEDDEDDTRDKQIAFALEGKNHIKLKQTPYLQITLSLEKIPELGQSATYQPPATRKLSKSAKARAKKREKKTSSDTPHPYSKLSTAVHSLQSLLACQELYTAPPRLELSSPSTDPSHPPSPDVDPDANSNPAHHFTTPMTHNPMMAYAPPKNTV
ncbi:hypothetical protein D9756_000012 [Leucocoprinus leucothites]|uniref:Uncharacterized protein n=1 Tax=Leucocoprinus leucothites TaxID=201217 RepID=A0A8H5GEC9_9AGAR|nr:hypothetical protein D9756_000012 [Leucoagaricus leucothites]